MIEVLLARLSKAKTIDEVVLATSLDQANGPLIDLVTSLGYKCFQGSEDDVLERFLGAAEYVEADLCVRITGDCPLIDPDLVDAAVEGYLSGNFDYFSNILPPTFPDGLDVEVVSTDVLRGISGRTLDPYHREHVTTFIRESDEYQKGLLRNETDHSQYRWTVDEAVDLAVIESVFKKFSPNIYFGWEAVADLQSSQPELFQTNSHLQRNEGAQLKTGQKLWKRAKAIIPGGNMLLSKRSEMFLPDYWPSYFSKAKDCRVWDLDDKEYIDMSIMGIGTNILGYGHPEIDEAVGQVIKSGNMSTLNCPEEVYLAEKLVEMHPWADMVRFARTGGEADAIAVRIARAASGRDKVAVCGYHGWHDWYLSANLLSDKSLDGHLLPGLDPKGVPRELAGSVLTFNYNEIEQLEGLIAENPDLGTIVMEVQRNSPPLDDFLQKVRSLADSNGIVLIFDECTSGFRQTFGGLHKLYGVEPDMAIFGKALGNGYGITATIGKREVMEAAQSTFISSTFWTERIGPAAALKTLEVMERLESWEVITQIGLKIRKGWQDLADQHRVGISHFGLPALAGFSFTSPNALAYKTYLTQELLAKGVLASNCVYACIDHSDALIEMYFNELDSVFAVLSKCEGNEDIHNYLQGPQCHGGFKRLN